MSLVDLVDDPFWTMLITDAQAWRADPRVIAQVMMSESGLDPEAVNPAQRDAKGHPIGGRPNLFAGDPAKACIGLNQLCAVNHHLFDPLDESEYQKLPASQQWQAGAGKFFDAQLRAHPEAGHDVAALYWLNYKPATYVKGAADDFAIGPDSSNQLLLDAGAGNVVTPASLRAFATRDASSARWKSVLAAIDAAEKGTIPANVPGPPIPKPAHPAPPKAPILAATSEGAPIALLGVLGFLAWRLARRKG